MIGFMEAAERDRILLSGSFEEQRAMVIEVTGIVPSCDEVVQRAIHRAITALSHLPEERRQQSREWLKKHRSEAWG
jgi:hypothetical protein